MRDHKTASRSHGLSRGATRSLALLLCLGTLAGVLIWAKLRLVTDIPRSAYADPRENGAGPDDAADGPDTAGDTPTPSEVPGAARP